MKKIVIMFLSALLFVGGILPTAGSAKVNNEDTNLKSIQSLDINQSTEITIVQDDKNKRVVEVVDKNDGKVYRSTFNKKNNSFKTVEINKSTNQELQVVLDSEALIQSEKSDVQLMSTAASSLIDSGSNLDGKFKYYYYTGKVWVVMSEGSSKNPTETTNNSSDLNSFRNSVNNLRGSEIKVQVALGTAATSTLIAAITAPTGWGPILATLTALGASVIAIDEAYNSWVLAKDCRFYYGRITIK